MKKATYNAHPKLIRKGFQEKVKQAQEKIIGNYRTMQIVLTDSVKQSNKI